MKKRFSKAARQTMLAAATLALLLAPFVCLGVQKVKNEALDSAFLWTIHAPHDVETYLSEHGLRPDSMPVSGTPDWYQLRVFLSIASSNEGWETPVILQYKDAQRNPTVQRSGLFAHCVDSDFSLLDFTDFAAKDLRALRLSERLLHTALRQARDDGILEDHMSKPRMHRRNRMESADAGRGNRPLRNQIG